MDAQSCEQQTDALIMIYSGKLSEQRRVSRHEWRTVLIFALIIMAITTIPYAIGVLSQRNGWQFGGFLFGAEDGNSYLAKMREGANGGWGDWLFHLAYTSERQDGAFLFTPYLLAGKVGGLFADTRNPALMGVLLLIFHAARIGFGVLAILVSYRFAALFLPRGLMRWAAIGLISVGGGFGWLLILIGKDYWLGSAPIDFYLPEAYTFFLLYGLPHLSLARAMLLGGFMLLFRDTTRSALLAGLCWLIMGFCVPFYVAVLYALLGAWGAAALIRYRRFPTHLFGRSLIAAIVPAPLLIYNLAAVVLSPTLTAFSRQNYLPSPNPLHYVVGLGLLALCAVPALRWAWRRGKSHAAYLLLPAWVIAAPLLAYVPVSVQRRLLEGVFVPLCILAIVGLRFAIAPWLVQHSGRTRRLSVTKVWQRLIAIVLLISLPSTLLLLFSGVIGGTHLSEPLFHAAGEVAALDWLNAHASPDSIVLSTKATGNYIPARTNLRVFTGHGPETLDSDKKRDMAVQFFDGGITLDSMQTPAETPIRYVFYGPPEAAGHAPDALAKWANGLTLIYSQDSYKIYEVIEQPAKGIWF